MSAHITATLKATSGTFCVLDCLDFGLSIDVISGQLLDRFKIGHGFRFDLKN